MAVGVPLAAETFDLPANIAFGILAAMMIFAAIKVVTTKNVVHAALWLVVVLLGIGADYLLLQAEFVAVTQIMVYIGAIVVLFLFGVMLTHNKLGSTDDADNAKMRVAGVLTGVVIVGVLAFALLSSYSDDKMTFDGAKSQVAASVADAPGGASTRTQTVSDSIFGEYLLPFELVSVLLLGALIGAIVLARKE